jgi:fucose permease
VSLSTPELSTTRQVSNSLAGWGFAGFIVLGLPDGMLGTAWPTMRQTFHQPLGNLGFLMVVAMLGNLVTSLSTSRLLRRIGAGQVMASAGVVGAVAVGLIAIAPVWWVVLVGGFLVGAAAGLIDTGLNTVIALTGRLRLLNLLHGAYGVGAAIGPLLVTVAIVVSSWRGGYLVMVVLETVLAVGWWLTRGQWNVVGPPPAGATTLESIPEESIPDGSMPDDAAAAEPTGVRVLAALGVVMFFCYTGAEMGAGAWAASFLRGYFHLSAGLAGPAVFAYPAALTLGRFATAVPKKTLNPNLAVWIGLSGGVVGAALIWWAPSVAVVVIALALTGVCFAPVFPAMVTLTPIRLGPRRAHTVIGWQIAAANVGGSGLSAGIGIVLQHQGLHLFGPSLLVILGLGLSCNVALELVSRSRRS